MLLAALGLALALAELALLRLVTALLGLLASLLPAALAAALPTPSLRLAALPSQLLATLAGLLGLSVVLPVPLLLAGLSAALLTPLASSLVLLAALAPCLLALSASFVLSSMPSLGLPLVLSVHGRPRARDAGWSVGPCGRSPPERHCYRRPFEDSLEQARDTLPRHHAVPRLSSPNRRVAPC